MQGMVKQKFVRTSEIQASPATVFAWHERPGVVEELTPPWEKVKILERGNGLQVGTRVVFRLHSGPWPQTWVAEHVEYAPPHLFADVQRQGPFAYWSHRHRFEPTPRGTTLMTDEIEYKLPFGWLGELVAGWFVRAKLKKMFEYRHQVVANAFHNSTLTQAHAKELAA
jgi:ligand-binding SRPBCC domain-containing protein